MNWVDMDEERPPICKDILFTDGNDVFAGWLETYEPLEEPSFYNTLDKDWPENITHWMPLPDAPKA